MGGHFGFFSGQFLFPLAAKFDFPLLKKFVVKHIPYKRVQEIAEVTDIMYQTSLDIIESKKKALASLDPEVAAEMSNKKDIISILSTWISFTIVRLLIALHTSASQCNSF